MYVHLLNIVIEEEGKIKSDVTLSKLNNRKIRMH